MSIKDKLGRLDATGRRETQAPRSEDWVARVQQELDVKVIREDKSILLLKENYFPVYNDPVFNSFQKRGFETDKLHLIASDLPAAIHNFRKCIFFDTETTGLAGGTGTYPFLIGIGHIELDHIVVRQYLLPEFGYEWLMLKYVDQAFSGFDFTVSFNGKSFDLPLLRNRFVLNRMETVIDDKTHIDALHAARRIWKSRLPACDLQSLERHILNVDRIGDIPGEAIPQIFFEFIRKRDAFLLRDVLEHNYHDIVNMVLLTLRIAAICQSPETQLKHPLDLYSMATYLFRCKRYEESLSLLRQLFEAEQAVSADLQGKALFMMAMASKKSGDSQGARNYLSQLIERNVLHPPVIEELAKYYEHEDRDYEVANDIVETGIRYLETILQLDPQSPFGRALPGLKHRQQRLLRKIAKAKADDQETADK